VEMTSIIDTPNFDNGEGANSVYGWNADGYNFGNDDTQKSALLLEFYNKSFDLNQEILGLPNGTYMLVANAFERTANPAYIYGASAGVEYAVELQKLVEDGTINSMVTASAAFEEGNYVNEVIFKVTDEKATIGIKKESNDPGYNEQGEETHTDWVIMDNFKLFYYGTNSTKGIKSVDLGESVKSEYFTIDGRQATAAHRGIIIVRHTLNNGTVVVRKVRK